MKKQLLIFYLLLHTAISHAQSPSASDSLSEKEGAAVGDDPSQFFTRMELFNEIQHHTNNVSDFYFE